MTAAESPLRPYTGTDMFYTDDSVAEMNCCKFCRQPVSDQSLLSWECCCYEFEVSLERDWLVEGLESIAAMSEFKVGPYGSHERGPYIAGLHEAARMAKKILAEQEERHE